MFGPAQLAPGRATITLTLLVLAVVSFPVATYWYVSGRQSAEQYYSKTGMMSVVVAFLLYQLGPSFSGWANTVVRAFTYVAVLVFLVANAQWWRYRGTEERRSDE